MGLTDLVSLNFNILESGAFNDLHNLRTLKLQENKFDEINVEIFNKLDKKHDFLPHANAIQTQSQIFQS